MFYNGYFPDEPSIKVTRVVCEFTNDPEIKVEILEKNGNSSTLYLSPAEAMGLARAIEVITVNEEV